MSPCGFLGGSDAESHESLRGPMREETNSWLNRIALGVPTQHATAAEGHNRLMLTKAIDLSARLKRPVKLPISPEDEKTGM